MTMNTILQFFMFSLLATIAFALPLERNQVENNVGEYGDYFEGDMELNEEQMETIFSPARNGIISDQYRWPNKTVPYQLSEKHTKEQNDYIKLALKTIASVSCVKFVRRTNEIEYVELRIVGVIQPLEDTFITIEVNCFRLGTIMHEFLHALGFYHMQSTYNRDDYVTIHWENIQSDTKNNFIKYPAEDVTDFNTTYDYHSVMHYEAYGFSKNGQPTIVPVDEKYLHVIGQREKKAKKIFSN